MPPEELGMVLAAATAIRLIAAPVAGRIGDRLRALRAVLVACIALGATATLGYPPAHGFWLFLCLTLLHAAFIAGTLVSGQLVAGQGSMPSSGRRRCSLVIVAALILGSHAMHDAFAPIRWRAAGIGAPSASVLWSLAVGPRFSSSC